MSNIKVIIGDSVVKLADKLNVVSDRFRYKHFACPVCSQKVKQYTPYMAFANAMRYMCRISPFTLETFNFPSYLCPNCNANDRDRLCALYLREFFSSLNKSQQYKFIDFAPHTESLAQLIKSQPFINYRSADLFMPNVDDTVDLQDMHIYADNSVDFFICSHILEHVPDDIKAMSELYRIMKPGGKGIAMVPIDLSREEIFEDSSITSDADRWTYFGQFDHLRLYSKKGFVERLQQAGFKVEQKGVAHFGEKVFLSAGIYPRSVLYIVTK